MTLEIDEDPHERVAELEREIDRIIDLIDEFHDSSIGLRLDLELARNELADLIGRSPSSEEAHLTDRLPGGS